MPFDKIEKIVTSVESNDKKLDKMVQSELDSMSHNLTRYCPAEIKISITNKNGKISTLTCTMVSELI